MATYNGTNGDDASFFDGFDPVEADGNVTAARRTGVLTKTSVSAQMWANPVEQGSTLAGG